MSGSRFDEKNEEKLLTSPVPRRGSRISSSVFKINVVFNCFIAKFPNFDIGEETMNGLQKTWLNRTENNTGMISLLF